MWKLTLGYGNYITFRNVEIFNKISNQEYIYTRPTVVISINQILPQVQVVLP
jgi:hypothetical protein